jgi:hypothetical protein
MPNFACFWELAREEKCQSPKHNTGSGKVLTDALGVVNVNKQSQH